jgi:DNA-binding response OmpR family regulator
MDTLRHEVTLDGLAINLRTQEFDLLLLLTQQPGRVFSREQLLEKAWGFDFYGQTRTVDVHIAQLRKRLTGSTVKIETVTGVGYKLIAES